jgi:hypothetical protein
VEAGFSGCDIALKTRVSHFLKVAEKEPCRIFGGGNVVDGPNLLKTRRAKHLKKQAPLF